jgi:hypothetical protein
MEYRFSGRTTSFTAPNSKVLISSIKGVKKKNTFPAAGFFLGFQPTALSKIVLAFRSVFSGRCFI